MKKNEKNLNFSVTFCVCYGTYILEGRFWYGKGRRKRASKL